MKLIPFSRYKISGHSMEPLYKEGQVVWVNNWSYILSKPKVGDTVVFHWQDKDLLKRVSVVDQDRVEVFGENKTDSLDSKKFGDIAVKQIIGKVLT